MFRDWFEPQALDYVTRAVDLEMESTKPLLTMYSTQITPKFTEEWDLEAIMAPVVEKTPIWTRILSRATTPHGQDPENKEDADGIRNRAIVCTALNPVNTRC